MAEGISRQALSALIASIYDCALDPSRWEQTLGELRQLLESETAMLGVLDVRQNRFIIAETAGLQAYGQSQVAQHAQEIAAILGDHLASISSLDEPFLMSRHLSPAYLETSSYKRVLDTQGLVDIMDYHLAHSITLIADIGFGRHERQGIFTNREIELGGLLLPHLRRSLTISNILDARTVEHERLAGVLDALRCGVVLTNHDGVILHANRAAELMFRNGTPIQDVRGTLRATAPSPAGELRVAIGLAARDEATIGHVGISILLEKSAVPPVFAHVLPLTGSETRTRLNPEAVAAIFISSAPDARRTAATVADVYGLTPAENRVLAHLLQGRTLAEAALALGVAATTAKTHLDNIFQKTCVSRQAELMRLSMQSAPPATALGWSDPLPPT